MVTAGFRGGRDGESVCGRNEGKHALPPERCSAVFGRNDLQRRGPDVYHGRAPEWRANITATTSAEATPWSVELVDTVSIFGGKQYVFVTSGRTYNLAFQYATHHRSKSHRRCYRTEELPLINFSTAGWLAICHRRGRPRKQCDLANDGGPTLTRRWLPPHVRDAMSRSQEHIMTSWFFRTDI